MTQHMQCVNSKHMAAKQKPQYVRPQI